MVSKSRHQRQKKKQKVASGNTEPTQISTNKSVHLKKTRPNMKAKMKVRMGMESADIYEGFDEKKGVMWCCPTCGRTGRVTGFCVECETRKVAPQPSSSSSATAQQKQQQKQDKSAVQAATTAAVKQGSKSTSSAGSKAKKN